MKKSKFSEEQIATTKTTAEEVQRALSLVKNSRPVLGTVLNKAGQMATTLASMRKLLSHGFRCLLSESER
jgi:hypothetical protein